MSKRSLLSVPGIYTITNSVTGRVYVGQTNNFRERWYNHRRTLRLGVHRNWRLQSDWNQFGEDAYIFAIHTELSHVALPDLADAMTRIEHAALCNLKDPYNINEAGDERLIVSSDTRALLSDINKERWTPEFRAQRSAATKALYLDPAWKAQRDAAVKAAKSTPEVRKSVGRHFKELWRDPAHRAAQSASQRANWEDPEYRERQRASRSAAWADPVVRQKRADAIRAAHARRRAAKAATAT